MVLPNKFATYDEYFLEAFDFLKKNQYIYNYANVDILTNKILNILKEKGDVNSFTARSNEYKHFYDGSSDILNIQSEDTPDSDSNEELYDHIWTRGLSKKKIHEIYKLSNIINNECNELGISAIIDLGSGLGYLSQLLHLKYGHRVIGVEGDEKRVSGAKIRQKDFFEKSLNSVHYTHKFITEESVTYLQNIAQEFFNPNENFILAGLHACGDLTVNAIKLFLNMERCKGLIIMPCCYHKMSAINNGSVKFINMPLSDALRGAFQEYNADSFIRQPFLRLSCQRSQRGWEDDSNQRQARIFHLMSRAILQLYAHNDNLKLVKKKRRAVSRIKLNQCDFATFLNDAITNGYSLKDSDSAKPRCCINIGVAGNSFAAESNYTFEDDRTKRIFNEASASKETEVRDKKSDEKMSDSNNLKKNTLDFDHEKIWSLWTNLTPEDFSAADLLMHLQDGMQAFCENIVLLDKLAYLNERKSNHGLENLRFKFEKVTDETISPRCNSLVAIK